MNSEAVNPDLTRHLTEDQWLDRLYRMDPSWDEHVEACSQCAARWESFQQRRGEILESDATSLQRWPLHWNEQRREVLERARQIPAHPSLRWTPVLATGFLLALGAWFFRPVPDAPPPPPVAAAPDPAALATQASWFTDTYSAAQVEEPRVAAPIRVLFEPQQEERDTE